MPFSPLSATGVATCVLVFTLIAPLSFPAQAGPGPTVVYVDQNAPGTPDGLSWDTAFLTIQQAIDASGSNVQIWVAEGTYQESIVMDDSNVSLLGGFASGNDEVSDRDIGGNPTTIDASFLAASARHHVVTIASISNATLDGFTLSGGHATGTAPHDSGGGVYCFSVNNTVTIANCTIRDNTATLYGGGVYLRNSSPNVTGCIIRNNHSEEEAGGLFAQSSASVIARCQVFKNTAVLWGGGISLGFNSSCTISECLIRGNTVSNPMGDSEGGGIYVSTNPGFTPTIRDCHIIENFAGSFGGGINCITQATIERCVISGNSSAGGGGIYLFDGGVITVESSLISGNDADLGGGVLAETAVSGCSFFNCTIADNNAVTDGGGILVFDNPLDIVNCMLTGNKNHAVSEDGAGADPMVMNCLFDGNPQGDYNDDISGTLTGAANVNSLPESCDNIDGPPGYVPTPAGHTGTWDTEPVFDPITDTTTITSSALNSADDNLGGRLINPDTSQSLQFLILEKTGNSITILGGPGVVAQLGDTYQILDYHLASNSPARNAGSNNNAPDTDWEGEARPDGGIVDIGADEYVDTDLDGMPDYLDEDDDNDGYPDEFEREAGTDPLNAGDTPTAIFVNNFSGNSKGFVQVLPDGTSWTSPFFTITEALQIAGPGAEIWVAGGIYHEGIELRTGVSLYGGFGGFETSREGTRIFGQNETIIDPRNIKASPIYHVVTIDSVNDVVIDLFTISGGNAKDSQSSGGGIYIKSAGGQVLVSNCTIRDNTASGDGGGVYIDNSSVTLDGCIVCQNRTGSSGGIAIRGDSNCIIDRCTIFDNDSASSGGIYLSLSNGFGTMIEQTVVVGNIGQSNYGGIYSSNGSNILSHCIVVGNYTDGEGGGLNYWDGCFATNCLFSGNRAENGGGVYSNEISMEHTIANCTIADNSAEYNDGGAGFYQGFSATNCIFANNQGYGIGDRYSGGISPATLTNCLFHGNHLGDYFFLSTMNSLTGATAINSVTFANNTGNVDGSPLFETGPSGTWTAPPVTVAMGLATLFTDSTASFTPNSMRGLILNASTEQPLQCYIATNSATTITVLGDMRHLGDLGDPYQVYDYHIRLESAAKDAGTATGAPDTDYDEEDRPQDGLFDIGFDEFFNYPPEIVEGDSIVIASDNKGTGEQFNRMLHATDDNQDVLTWSLASLPSHGTAVASGTGTSVIVGYTPDPTYTGDDSFIVRVMDPSGGMDAITVNATVIAVPTATPSPSSTPANTATSTPQPTTTSTGAPTPTNTSLMQEPTATASNTPGGPTETPSASNTPEGPTATPTLTNTPGGPTETATATIEGAIPTATPTWNFDVAPLVLDGKIDSLDLLEWYGRIQNGTYQNEILFDFSLQWGIRLEF